jgi:hypothetical protein
LILKKETVTKKKYIGMTKRNIKGKLKKQAHILPQLCFSHFPVIFLNKSIFICELKIKF